MEPPSQLNPAGREIPAEPRETGPDAAPTKQREEPGGKPGTSPQLEKLPPQQANMDRAERAPSASGQVSHSEEYKMLREEILQHMRGLTQAQTWAVVGGGAVYAWLMTHRELLTGPWRYAWFIPPVIGLACSIISLETDYRIRHVAAYLRRIEEAAFGKDSEVPGWEHYKTAHRSSDTFGNLLGAALWVVAIAGSFALSWFCMSLPTMTAAPK